MSNFLIAFRLIEKEKKEEREGRKIPFFPPVIHEFRHVFMLSMQYVLFFFELSTQALCPFFHVSALWKLHLRAMHILFTIQVKILFPSFSSFNSSRCFLSYTVLKLSSPISQYLFSLLGLEVLFIPNSSILTHIFT